MRVARVVGTVTLNICHPSFVGATLKLVRMLSLDDLQSGAEGDDEEVIAWDELGASLGDLIAVSDGGEAAQPFRPNFKPVDVYNAAILDSLDL